MVAIFAVYGTMAYFVQTLTIARPKMAADLDGMACTPGQSPSQVSSWPLLR